MNNMCSLNTYIFDTAYTNDFRMMRDKKVGGDRSYLVTIPMCAHEYS